MQKKKNPEKNFTSKLPAKQTFRRSTTQSLIKKTKKSTLSDVKISENYNSATEKKNRATSEISTKTQGSSTDHTLTHSYINNTTISKSKTITRIHQNRES